MDYEDILFKNRIIQIDKEFTDETCSTWAGKILSLDLLENNKIILLINSRGGDINSTLGIIDIIQSIKSPVYTVCVGSAFSSASVLLIVGIKRFATQNSTIMIHQASVSLEEIKTSDIVNEAKEMKRLHNIFVNLYLNKTTMSKRKIESIHSKDSYFGAEEALKLGIIDEIGFKLDEWIK